MIQQAMTTDLERIAALGSSFFEECDLPGSFNSEHFCKVWSNLMLTHLGEIWYDIDAGEVTGAVGVLFTPDPNDGTPILTEMFWYVNPEHRGTAGYRLFKQLLTLAGKHDVSRIHVSAVHSSPTHQAVEKLYARHGFTPIETLWIKKLWPSQQQQLSQ